MTNASDDTLGRRTFLKQMATVAGTAPLAPALFGATAASAQTEPPAPQGAEPSTRPSGWPPMRPELRYEDLPPAVVQRAKDCIIDAVSTISFGAELPWSKMIIAYAQRYGAAPGKSAILGTGGRQRQRTRRRARQRRLGACFRARRHHLAEQRHASRRRHCSPLALAVAQERGLGGRDLVTAFVAGGEVMFRIGYATKHSNETRGFHAPGTTGPFGAAVAVGRLRQFDAARMTNALGIAGSLACGLLEFVNAGNGAMVKRLHLGRAAESGVLAASLAARASPGLRPCWKASSVSCACSATSGTCRH